MSALLTFVSQDDLKSVNDLLTRDQNTLFKDERGRSPLFLSSEKGNHRISSLLLSYGANVNEEDLFRVTPIQIATINGHSKVVKLLLDHGADRNVASPRYEDTLVSMASVKNDMETVMLLINEGEEEYKGEALSFSIIKACYWVAINLVSMGAEWTNKHWGLLSDYTNEHIKKTKKEAFKLAEWLINENISLNGVLEGKAPINYVIEQGNISFFNLLIKNGAKIDSIGNIPPLITAIHNGNIEITKKLLLLDVEVNCIDLDGLTPLHHAVRSGNLELVQILIERGSDIDSIDNKGNTPLHLSSKYKFIDIQQYLLDNAGDTNLINEEGFAPLEYSMPEGYLPTELITDDYELRLKTLSKRGDDFIVILTRYTISTHKWVGEDKLNEYIFPADQYHSKYSTNLLYDGNIGKLVDFIDDFTGVFFGSELKDLEGASILVERGNNNYTHYIDDRTEEFETDEPILWFSNVIKDGGVVIPIAGTANKVLYMGDYSYDKDINHYNIENRFENAEEFVDFYLGMT